MTAQRFIAADAIQSEIKKFAENILAPAIGQIVGELETQIDQIEAAIREFVFKGQWVAGKEYKRGNFCSVGGAVYHCQVDTTTRPGTDDKVWSLAIPRARDGRDGKDYTPPDFARSRR